MIRSIAATVVLVLFGLVLRRFYEDVLGMPGLPAAVSLGLILVASYTFSRLFVPLHLPRICAYLVMGMVCGPFGLGLISAQGVEELRLIERLAIALIALTAGGEIRWTLLRQHYRRFLVLTGAIPAVVVPVVAVVFLFVAPRLTVFSGAAWPTLLVAAALLGVAGTVKAVATTVAVIKESRARGPLAETVLTVLLMLDIAAIFLYTLLLALADSWIAPAGGGLHLADVLGLVWRIGGALPVGAAIGLLASWCLRLARGNDLLFVSLLCLLLVVISLAWKIDLIMMGVITGFAVENLSNRGDEMMGAIDRSYLPVYVAFFTLAGAGISLHFLMSNWALTTTLVLLFAALTWLGAELGGWLSGMEKPLRHYVFMGLIGQAGINLGFAIVIRDRLSWPLPSGPTLGEVLYTIILACIAINEMIGPILFRFALERMGEIGASDRVPRVSGG